LPFAPSESADSLSKTIFPQVPYFLFVTNETRPVRFAAKGTFADQGDRTFVINQIKDLVFLLPGEYILHVTVSGKGVVSASAKLKFVWKVNPLDSTMEKID
jgi:hypothetical protein